MIAQNLFGAQAKAGNFQTRKSIRPRLGEGVMSAPTLSAGTLADIRENANAAISKISSALDDLEVYAQFLAPNVLRVDPLAYRTIPDIGEAYTPEELRTILHGDASTLGAIANRIGRGSAGRYVTGDQVRQFDELYARANGVMARIKSSGQMSPVSDLGLASQQQEAVTQDVAELLGKIEKAIVSGEAGAVPVLEPYEQETNVLRLALGIGITAALAYTIWRLI
jgi:hypothetical protein